MPGRHPTDYDIANCLVALSAEKGYCLCARFPWCIIAVSGVKCSWCRMPVTASSATPEAAALRGQALKTAYPDLIEV